MVGGKHLDGLLSAPVFSYMREVNGICGAGSRTDFVLEHACEAPTRYSVLEVKVRFRIPTADLPPHHPFDHDSDPHPP